MGPIFCVLGPHMTPEQVYDRQKKVFNIQVNHISEQKIKKIKEPIFFIYFQYA